MAHRKIIGAVAALSLFAAAADTLAQPAKQDAAAGFPSRPIRLVLMVPPGGGSDGLARTLAPRLTENLHQQVIVDNRPGAGGIIGTEIVARSNPDGYTLGLVTVRHAVNQSMYNKLPYDALKDFEPVTMAGSFGSVLVVNPKSPINSVKELIAMARQKPGELTFASSGAGGGPHLIGEFFALTTGIKLTHIPYKGGGPAITDLIAGNVTMSFATLTSALQFVKSKRLRALAVVSKERSSQLPEVPTMAEAGVPNIVVRDWVGIIAPRGTPKPILDKLAAEVSRALKDPTSQERLTLLGVEVVGSTPGEFREVIASDIPRWGKVVKAAGITPE
jgi:tripartite-type tricarboxylate transporter receptor subunit TctC